MVVTERDDVVSRQGRRTVSCVIGRGSAVKIDGCFGPEAGVEHLALVWRRPAAPSTWLVRQPIGSLGRQAWPAVARTVFIAQAAVGERPRLGEILSYQVLH